MWAFPGSGRRGREAFEGCLRSRWNRDRPRGRYSLKAKSQWVRLVIKGNPHLSATRGAIISACLKPPVHAVLVEHMPTRKQPQILLRIIILQTDEALHDNDKKPPSAPHHNKTQRCTYPIDAHRRDAPELLVLGERAHTYHLEARIINVLLGRCLRLRLTKELREFLKRIERVRAGHELVSRRVISWSETQMESVNVNRKRAHTAQSDEWMGFLPPIT